MTDEETQVATQYDVDRQAMRNMNGSYSDAWRYFERMDYDMSQVIEQYSEHLPEGSEY